MWMAHWVLPDIGLFPAVVLVGVALIVERLRPTYLAKVMNQNTSRFDRRTQIHLEYKIFWYYYLDSSIILQFRFDFILMGCSEPPFISIVYSLRYQTLNHICVRELILDTFMMFESPLIEHYLIHFSTPINI